MMLFRGENIIHGNPNRVHTFKSLMRHGLPLDFINGGNPYRVEQIGLFDATVRHVLDNCLGTGSNGHKHFMSFSESSSRAEEFAMTRSGGTELNDYEMCEDHYTRDLRDYLDSNIWDYTQHLRIELDSSAAMNIAGHPFLKTLSYNEGRNQLILLDVVSYLKTQRQNLQNPTSQLAMQFPSVLPDVELALDIADGDSEWLVASNDLISPQSGRAPSKSAMIAHGNILEIKHHVDPDYFTQRQ